jgi:hypothetical protein
VIDAEGLAASVAVELVATGAQHLAAGGSRTGANFQEGIAAVFVVLDGKTVEEGVAGEAGSGGKLRSHDSIMLDISVYVKIKTFGIWNVMLFYGHLR